jgi:DNA gyrase subunit A
MIPVRQFDDQHYLVMATMKGVIKKTMLSEYQSPRKGGIRAVNLDEGDELIGVVVTNGENELMIATRAGIANHFHEKDVRSMGRGTRGVIGIDLRQDDVCVSLMVATPQCTALTVSELGLAKRSPFEDYRLTKRGAKGVVNMNVTEKTGLVVACMAVLETDEVMVITSGGQVIRTSVNGCRVIGRNTQGVKIIRLDGNDKVVAVARLAISPDAPDDGTEVSGGGAEGDGGLFAGEAGTGEAGVAGDTASVGEENDEAGVDQGEQPEDES